MSKEETGIELYNRGRETMTNTHFEERKNSNRGRSLVMLVEFSSWQGFVDEDRTFYSVTENVISGGQNV